MTTTPTLPMPARMERLDAWRGVAIVWMALFHFSFDLNHFGLMAPPQNFYADSFWTGQRTAIVTLFMLCAGAGQAVAQHAGQTWSRFWRRWGQIAACALLVSLGSMWMFPRSWISFGVLHGMAVMLIVARAAAPMRWALWPLGALCLALPHWLQHPAFDARALNWLGLVTRKPVTEDFVPVLPWLGVMLWGLAAGQYLITHRPQWLAGHLPAVLRPLALLGRWSLSFYMLHQPVFIGALMAYLAWR